MNNNRLPVIGATLAGGQGYRMNGEDKGLIMLNERPLYQHVLHSLQRQVDCIVINANRNLDRYRESGLPVIADTLPNYPGPLAGILAVLSKVKAHWVVFAPCDTPWLPDNWVMQLWQQKNSAPAVWLKSAERNHPTLVMINIEIKQRLYDFLNSGGRNLMKFLVESGGHAVQLDDQECHFSNINTPEDLAKASICPPHCNPHDTLCA